MGQGTRDRGQERNGTRDAGRGTGKWEGEAFAEPSFRQIVRWANRQVGKEGEWRLTNSEGFFLEGSVPALPKIFGASGDAPYSFPSLL
ncbi:hypothetical protein [Fervidibacter sp.]|jgi:hypothetical protein